MERIISHIDPSRLLHVIYRREDLVGQSARGVNLSPDPMALQARAINARGGEVFPAHKHPPQDRHTTATQESLVIIEGAIEATYHDIDDSVLHITTLRTGDCVVSFEGGHGYRVIEPTIMYEYKNGPYNGMEKDKIALHIQPKEGN
jgi:hypothetical protein